MPVFSLYQASSRRIQPEMLANVDALVFDIQDVGARFYTYSCTMLYSMEEAAKKTFAFFCPGPPKPDHGSARRRPHARRRSSVIHRMLRNSGAAWHDFGRIGGAWRTASGSSALDLHVIPMRGWDRGDWFDSTGLPWVDPSPNMRSLNAAILYPGLAMLEASHELFGGARNR